ncbi:hypothetical protein PhCBS80983_g04488 [Powellomyces hirtus]|uniref:RNA helicase n=1 Tax=Powellomyces hirtus TaxID=109895 RepID=A0A507E0H3_9FUNG|nr:hypothetical protein PhCBS80983_g04488 [Powellomyces hirtus]
MGKLRPRYNEKARAGSHLAKTAKPHPAARDGGLKKLKQKRSVAATTPSANETSNQEVTYSASASVIPDIIIPGEKGPSNVDLSFLPEEPTGKMTSKKKKRLEKFIEKQLKKEERVSLLKKLGETQFSSGLLRSSKAFGQTKLTAREKLRQALLEERAGIARSDKSINLTVEKEVEEYEESDDDESDFEAEGALPATGEHTVAPSNAEKQPEKPIGIVGLAFGSALAGPAEVQVFDAHITKETVASPAPPVFGSSLKPTFGGALKRKAEDGAETGEFVIPKRKKKKQQKKKAAPVVASDSDDGSDSDASVSNNEESDKDGNSEAEDEETVTKKKDMWAADVVDGESLPLPSKKMGPVSSKTKAAASKASVAKPTKGVPTPPAFHVPINRPESIQLARISLPVVMEEQPIMEAIVNNDVTILCGETGSGKTTQVPQFLYEAGFGNPKHPQFPGMVGITQPRRVAAMSMARRVAEEMALNKGEVAYQVRYDRGETNQNTRIKFMTDGILLRELSVAAGGEAQTKNSTAGPADLLLSKYSCIIIDEAHERTIGTDVLIGWLTRIVSLRNSGKIAGVKPLKLVIMSATLRVEDFTMNETLFPVVQRPPVVQVDGRQHKVVIHYNKKTPDVDYSSEAFKKISKIHMNLPPGGILVFMSGQQEIQILVRKLRKEFPLRKGTGEDKNKLEEQKASKKSKGGESLFEEADDAADADVEMGRGTDDFDDNDNADGDDEDDEEEDVEILGGLSEDEEEAVSFTAPGTKDQALPLHVLPLYSLLPTEAQMRVFDAPPPGTRLVVVATNVAETSLTIPGIKYVVDCGKVKERRFDTHSGVQTYQVCWTSRASADQRAGRAGRTGPGHCYRLFSSAVFNDYFEQFSQPEILRIPIEGVVLQMKSMGINNVVGFPFPTPPGRDNLRAAEKLLINLNALSDTDGNKITELGKIMAKFPVSPRYAKMIIVAASQPGNILAYVIAIVAGLSVGDPFIRDEDIIGRIQTESEDEAGMDEDDEEKQRLNQKRASFHNIMLQFSCRNKETPPTSDALRLLSAIGAHTFETGRKHGNPNAFCEKHFMRAKSMDEMRKLRQQLTNLVKVSLGESQHKQLYPSVKALCVDPNLARPDARESAAILQVILAGFVDRVAKLDEETSKGYGGKKYVPVYRTMTGSKTEVCRIHPSSCLYREAASQYVAYEELQGREEKISNDNSGIVAMRSNSTLQAPDGTELTSLWMKGVSIVEPGWIANVAPKSLCRLGKVVEQPEPRWDPAHDKIIGFCVPNFGPKMWDLPAKEVELPKLQDRCKWFARRLIEGKIELMNPVWLQKHLQQPVAKPKKKTNKNGAVKPEDEEIFALLYPFLATKTITITKEWGSSQPKVTALVSALFAAGIDSRVKLVAHWQQEQRTKKDDKYKSMSFLLDAYLQWVPDEFHAALRQYWPPAVLLTPDDDDDEKDKVRRGELCRSVTEIANSGGAGKRKQKRPVVDDVSDGDSDF